MTASRPEPRAHCPLCKSRKIKRGTFTDSQTIAGVRFTAEVPADVCGACGESFVWINDVGDFETAVARQLALRSVCVGEAFKYMRKTLSLRAVDLAELFGVTPETISHWENGKPDALAFTLLGSMVLEYIEGQESIRERLRALRNPVAPRTKPVRLTPISARSEVHPAKQLDVTAQPAKPKKRSRSAA
jgi:putative zinc finger/helix-turn-helix YgiT family protein